MCSEENQPFDYPRSKARGLPSARDFGVSSVERSGRGLSLPAGRQGLILSGAFDPVLKAGVWRRRSIKVESKVDEGRDVIVRYETGTLECEGFKSLMALWNKGYKRI